MPREGKTKPPSKSSGKRFKDAIEICGKKLSGKTVHGVLNDPFFTDTLEIRESKTLYRWGKNGVPNGKVARVAAYFGVHPSYFTDENIPHIEFENAIREAFAKKNGLIESLPPKKDPPSDPPPTLEAVRLQSHGWFDRGCPYREIEKQVKALEINLFLTGPYEDQTDERLMAFLMIASLHFGENWRYWVERNAGSAIALERLMAVLTMSSFDRPRLRALYALKVFPPEWINARMTESFDPEWREVIETYVFNGECIAYIAKQRTHKPQKVNDVLKEIKTYWGEDIPHLGLFGMSPPEPFDRDAFRRIDKPGHLKLISAAGHLEIREEVLSFLLQATGRPDPTERYWIYRALGGIGGSRAGAAIEKTLKDLAMAEKRLDPADEVSRAAVAFEKKGAEEAMKMLKPTEKEI